MFVTVVKPHYRLDTKGRFYFVTRKGELVFSGMFLAASRRGEKPDKQDVLTKPKTAKAPSNRIGSPRKQVLKPRFKASAISSRGNRARTK